MHIYSGFTGSTGSLGASGDTVAPGSEVLAGATRSADQSGSTEATENAGFDRPVVPKGMRRDIITGRYIEF